MTDTVGATLAARDPWAVFNYEARMLADMYGLLRSEAELLAKVVPLKNAVVESSLLHLRQLVDILIGHYSHGDEITYADLVKGYTPKRIEDLRIAYGERKTKGSHCWTLNKIFAHPTKERRGDFNYTKVLEDLAPIVLEIV